MTLQTQLFTALLAASSLPNDNKTLAHILAVSQQASKQTS